MTHQYIDPSLTPSDIGDPYDGDREERLLEDIAKHYKVEQVYGYDVFEEPCIAFFKWMEERNYIKHANGFYNREYPIGGKQTWFTINELYQIHWSELNK